MESDAIDFRRDSSILSAVRQWGLGYAPAHLQQCSVRLPGKKNLALFVTGTLAKLLYSFSFVLFFFLPRL